MTDDPLLRIEVAYAGESEQTVLTLRLPRGATVADALSAAAASPPFSGLDLGSMPVGVFGDRVERDRVLEDLDRVELYRPLRIDPREARQRRAAKSADPLSSRSRSPKQR